MKSPQTIKKGINLGKIKDLQLFYGVHDEHLKVLEGAFQVSLSARGHDIIIEGKADDVSLTEQILKNLEDITAEGYEVTRDEFLTAVRNVRKKSDKIDIKDLLIAGSVIETRKKKLYPKTPKQKRYIDSMIKNDLVFSIGPAGTGKTYLAVAMAVTYLLKKKVSRIILARPAVEAGESLGFLPGDMYEKINPYLRPLYDALYDMLDVERVNRLIEKGVIEIAPIAFMRGRTLNDSFIILDEAQNTTAKQMKMFLTRLGFNAKVVVTGDVTQIDLKGDRRCGLLDVQNFLNGIPGIDFIYLDKKDVIRCKLVKAIVEAYEENEAKLLERSSR
ncbi:PhoH family protein [bacterium]|nr:PhoH family protein [bacterium]